MFNRRITKKDYPGILNAMGNDLEAARAMVARMDEWANQADLGDLADALFTVFMTLKDAHEAAHDAWRKANDEIEKEAQER